MGKEDFTIGVNGAVFTRPGLTDIACPFSLPPADLLGGIKDFRLVFRYNHYTILQEQCPGKESNATYAYVYQREKDKWQVIKGRGDYSQVSFSALWLAFRERWNFPEAATYGPHSSGKCSITHTHHPEFGTELQLTSGFGDENPVFAGGESYIVAHNSGKLWLDYLSKDDQTGDAYFHHRSRWTLSDDEKALKGIKLVFFINPNCKIDVGSPFDPSAAENPDSSQNQ